MDQGERRNPFSAELVLKSYHQGIFPMAGEDGRIRWYFPALRTILPLETFHVSNSLKRFYRQKKFEVTVDRQFKMVMDGCANRKETWISQQFIRVYSDLNQQGFAHSVEVWRGEELAGGLYGVALGGAFFGESMFHHLPNASKIALVYLVERMKERGMVLLDTQFNNPFLRQFHTREIPAQDFLRLLRPALFLKVSFV